jgi:hypothetical protein
MSLTPDQFFALLPAVYRNRDALTGGPLQALFAVLAGQSDIVEANIQQLYDDQFIETCATWVIPYIGDLIGYNSIYEITSTSFDSRAEVANTISYRRRKGTLLALEQLSLDVSGRPAMVVEEFKNLITTESMRLVRPSHITTVDLRDNGALDRFVQTNSPFDTLSRTINVRRIAPPVLAVQNPDVAPLETALHGGGSSNIPDIGIHLWRCKNFAVTNAPAFVAGGGRYKFSPLGDDIPLFNQTPARASFSGLTTRIDVPQPIDRCEFQQSLKSGATTVFYGSSILLIADGVNVPASRIVCANLSDRSASAWCQPPKGMIAIDPVLGRIQYATGLTLPKSLRVNYSYGFPAEIAGGPYDRSASLSVPAPAQAKLYAVIGTTAYPTVQSAVTAWNALAAGSVGVIVLPNFESYAINFIGANALQLPSGSSLAILSGQPLAPPPTGPAPNPPDVIWNNSCATLIGNINVQAPAAKALAEGEPPPAGQLLLCGLRIAGQLTIGGQSATVQISDCTLVPGLGLTSDGNPVSPGEPSIIVTATEAALSLLNSISGPIAADTGGSTRICSSIIDATSPCCAAYTASDGASAGADLQVQGSTIIGKVHTRTMTLASNTIFYSRLGQRDPWPAAVWSSRRQTGCVRFCWLPFASITPQRYQCLPPDASSEAALTPGFVTLAYGLPYYCLLSGYVPMAVWQGSDSGSQIGVYASIQETEAVRNVQLRAPEFLPVCLESGIFLHPSSPLVEGAPAQGYYGSRAKYSCDCSDDFTGIGSGLV